MARLRLNENDRWEIYGGMHATPHEVTSGQIIYVEVERHDTLKPTRIEFVHGKGGGYVSADGYPLWDGMRAEIAAKR